MKLTHCPNCHSEDLAHGYLGDFSTVYFTMGFFKRVGVAGATCLACGAITPYLGDGALAKVRTWNAVRKPAKAVIGEL